MPTLSSLVVKLTLDSKEYAKGLDKAAQSTKGPVSRIANNLKSIETAYAGIVGAGSVLAAKKVFEFSQEGAQVTQLRESFERMNESVFKTPNLLNQMREAVRGTIPDTQLMQGLLTLSAGSTDEVARAMAQASPKLLEIAKASNKLNPALGDTSFLFDSISRGVKRQSPLILDNLGIVINLEKAYKDYAESLGVSVSELDANDRVMATLNATMEAGDQLIRQVGGDVGSAADSYASLSVEVENLNNKLKEQANVLLGPVFKGVNEFLNVATDSGEAVQKQTDAIEKSVRVNGDAADRVMQLGKAFKLSKSFLGSFTFTSDDLAESIARMLPLLAGQVETLDQFRKILRQSSVSEGEFRRMTGLTTEAFFEQNHAIYDAVIAATKYGEEVGYADQVLRNYIKTAEPAAEVTAQTEEQMEAAAEAAEAYGNAMSGARRANQGFATSNRSTEDIFYSMGQLWRKGEENLDLLNEELDDLGKFMVTIGGRTADQNAILSDATDEYERLGKEIARTAAAPELYGLNAEDAAEKIRDMTERQQELLPLMDRMGSITGTAAFVTKEATANIDAMNTALFEQVKVGGASSEQIAAMGLALGVLNEEQAAAIVKSFDLATGIEEISRAYKAETLSAEGARQAIMILAEDGIDAMRRFMDQLDWTADEAAALEQKIKDIGNAIRNLPDEKKIRILTEFSDPGAAGYTSSGGPVYNPPESPTPTPQAGGTPPEYQHGGHFIVPPGGPFPMIVHPGEEVEVTPRSQVGRSGGGDTYNITFSGAVYGEEALVKRMDEFFKMKGRRANIISRGGTR